MTEAGDAFRRRWRRGRHDPSHADGLAQTTAQPGRAGWSGLATMTEASNPLRGRRGRERRMDRGVQRAVARVRPHATPEPAASGERRGPADLSVLPALLAATAELRALAERLGTPAGGVGRDRRHVTYGAMPHGAKTFLAAALSIATEARLVWIARDAEIADRVAEELAAWAGPSAVVTLEARTALAYERSELVRDETAARVAALADWHSGDARILVAGVQALVQRTLPDGRPGGRAARPASCHTSRPGATPPPARGPRL